MTREISGCIFGPVPSRRLGRSLGVDLVPCKVCSLDCVYCQIGRTTVKTLERKEYVPSGEVLRGLEVFLESGAPCDYITLAGSGEPTLNSAMGDIIRGIKELTATPVAVLTNSTLMTDEKVMRELSFADLVVPSLDAATQAVFEQVNRPAPGLMASGMIDSHTKFKKTYDVPVWLEVMMVSGINDSPPELERIRDAVRKINPDRVQLNTVVRPPAEEYAKPVPPERMMDIAGFLGAEIIAEYDRRSMPAYSVDVERQVTGLLRRRPCTVAELSSALGLHASAVLKYIETLERDGVIGSSMADGKRYYRFTGMNER